MNTYKLVARKKIYKCIDINTRKPLSDEDLIAVDGYKEAIFEIEEDTLSEAKKAKIIASFIKRNPNFAEKDITFEKIK